MTAAIPQTAIPQTPNWAAAVSRQASPPRCTGMGTGHPVMMILGLGPGVSAWSNWRLNLPVFAQTMPLIAPDCVGFGYTERPAGIRYDVKTWVGHLVALLDVLDIELTDLIVNSFGGSMALALAIRHPNRMRRMVSMGSVGVGLI